jgi:hypothetical protein
MNLDFQEAQLKLFLVPAESGEQGLATIPIAEFPHQRKKVVVIRVDTAGREARLSSQEGN